LTVPHVPIDPMQMPRKKDQVANGHVSDLIPEHAGRIRDPDSQLFRSCEVDVVDAHSPLGYDLQPIGMLQGRSRHPIVADDDPVDTRQQGDELILTQLLNDGRQVSVDLVLREPLPMHLDRSLQLRASD
jgi:hypothetical protein